MEQQEELLCVENTDTSIRMCMDILTGTRMCMFRRRKRKVTNIHIRTIMNIRMSIFTNMRNKGHQALMNMWEANTVPTIINTPDMRKRDMNIKRRSK